MQKNSLSHLKQWKYAYLLLVMAMLPSKPLQAQTAPPVAISVGCLGPIPLNLEYASDFMFP